MTAHLAQYKLSCMLLKLCQDTIRSAMSQVITCYSTSLFTTDNLRMCGKNTLSLHGYKCGQISVLNSSFPHFVFSKCCFFKFVLPLPLPLYFLQTSATWNYLKKLINKCSCLLLARMTVVSTIPSVQHYLIARIY